MNTIDFENIKWGSFTKQFQAYKSQHPKSRIKDLDAFAKMVVKHPKKYQPRTLKRARFYLNVIEKKGGSLDQILQPESLPSADDLYPYWRQSNTDRARIRTYLIDNFGDGGATQRLIQELETRRNQELQAPRNPARKTLIPEKYGKGEGGELSGGMMSVTDALKLAGEIAGGIGGYVLLDRLYKWAYHRFQNNEPIPVPIAELLNARHIELPHAEAEVARPTPLADVEMGRGRSDSDSGSDSESDEEGAGRKGGKLSVSSIKGLLDNSYKKHPDNYLDFELDKELSGQRVQVYKKKGDKQAVVVHRGTASPQDWVTDLKYALGFNVDKTKRFQHAEDIQRKAEAKYGAENISTLGHSLGSKIASTVGQNSHEIINLNKAVSPLDAFKKTSEKETNLRTQYDPVSFLLPFSKSKNVITIPSKTLNPLAEHKIDTLERLGTPDAEIGRGLHKKSLKELKQMVKALPKNKRIKLSKIKKGDLVNHLCSCGGAEERKIDEPNDVGSLYEYHLDNWYKKNGY